MVNWYWLKVVSGAFICGFLLWYVYLVSASLVDHLILRKSVDDMVIYRNGQVESIGTFLNGPVMGWSTFFMGAGIGAYLANKWISKDK